MYTYSNYNCFWFPSNRVRYMYIYTKTFLYMYMYSNYNCFWLGNLHVNVLKTSMSFKFCANSFNDPWRCEIINEYQDTSHFLQVIGILETAIHGLFTKCAVCSKILHSHNYHVLELHGTCTCRSHLNTGVLTHNTKLSTFPDSYQIFCFISSQETMQNKANWIHWDQRKQFVIIRYLDFFIHMYSTCIQVFFTLHVSLLMYNVVFIHFNIYLLLIAYIRSDRGGLGDTWV